MSLLRGEDSSPSRELDARKDGYRMQSLSSNRDAFLLAIPMVILLFAAFFRLDELICGSRKPPEPGRRLSNWDKDGVPVFTDPVRTVLRITRKEY